MPSFHVCSLIFTQHHNQGKLSLKPEQPETPTIPVFIDDDCFRLCDHGGISSQLAERQHRMHVGTLRTVCCLSQHAWLCIQARCQGLFRYVESNTEKPHCQSAVKLSLIFCLCQLVECECAALILYAFSEQRCTEASYVTHHMG